MNIIRISSIDLYNHLKVKYVRIVRNIFLSASPIMIMAQPVVKKTNLSWKTSCARPRWFNVNVFMPILLYNIFPSFNLIRRYITDDHMLTLPYIFYGLISSTFVLDVYGLIWRILYLIVFRTYCKVTAPLVKHRVIANGPLYGFSYLYAPLLLSMIFIFNFRSSVQLF